jgi:hypothetical protein
MPPAQSTHSIVVHGLFNEAYKQMDFLSANLEYQSFKERASDIATQIDALHHDYANHMQMEVDGL